MKSNIILGAIENYEYEDFRPFLESLEKVEYGDKVVSWDCKSPTCDRN